MNRAKLRGPLVVAVVFALGAITGGAAVHWRMQRQYLAELGDHSGRRMERRRLEAMTRELDLSERQRGRVEAILGKHRDERRRAMERLGEKCGAELSAYMAGVDAEIRAVLTAEQRRRFDVLRERRAGQGPLWGPGPGGGRGGGHGWRGGHGH